MNKKLTNFYILIGVVTIGIFIGSIMLPTGTVTKSNEIIKTNNKWNRVMSISANKKNITLVVDGKNIDVKNNNLYMSEKMELMLPATCIIDSFNCAQNLYNKSRLVIEKQNNKAELYIGKTTVKYNGKENILRDKVQVKNGVIYIPASVLANYFQYSFSWDSKTSTAVMNNTYKGKSYLPEKYSYVEAKRDSQVKDQGDYGTCWAFATLTALETTLRPEEKMNFSENNLINNNALSKDIEDGGDYIMSMAYLMSWRGPVLEKDDPYGSKNFKEDLEAVKHVQGAEIIPSKDYNQIKSMIYKFGGVESSIYMSMNDSTSSSVYYNKEKYAYCYMGKEMANHDIVIIGWDDNFPKEYFNNKSIKGNGAFLCKNSWGSEFGDNGNFYISYYDDVIGTNNVCYTNVEDTSNFDNIYQSDLCGWTGSMGYKGNNSSYFANVYTASENENVEAVGFYATTNDLEYQVFVCEKFENPSSLNERNHIAAYGSINNKGYYTVDLDKKYSVNKDEKFAVIVKVTKKSNNKIFKIIPVEIASKNITEEVDLSDGEGYFSSVGYNWQSAEKQKCNICLKAYTSDK